MRVINQSLDNLRKLYIKLALVDQAFWVYVLENWPNLP